MSAVVLYESEFGATRQVAEAITAGFREVSHAALENVRDVVHPLLMSVDLLIVGAPTHVRSLPTDETRQSARTWPDKPGSTLRLEPHTELSGVREWLASAHLDDVTAVAFATRMEAPRALTGSATHAIERGLRHAGATIGNTSETFVVDKRGRVLPDEILRATTWGHQLAETTARAWAGGVA